MNIYLCSRYILVLFKLAQRSSTLQSLVEPVELGELEELRRKRRRGSGFAEEKKQSWATMRTFPIILTTILKNKYQRNKYLKKSLKYLGNLNPKDGLTGTGKFRLPDIRWKLG